MILAAKDGFLTLLEEYIPADRKERINGKLHDGLNWQKKMELN